jgi:lipopolysaccharide/colanic/teichoic acid biosynthesis glycosyltransferase
MELALQYNSTEQDLINHQTINSLPVTKRILRIEGQQLLGHEYVQEDMHFTYTSVQGALDSVRQQPFNLDAIIITPDQLTTNITFLREIGKQKAVPFLLYTSKFEQSAKDLAMKLGLDEYHYGAMSYLFLKKIDFIKRLKSYKVQRGNKPYTDFNAADAVPQVKFYGLKRAVDIVLPGFALIFLSPLMLLISIIIKLESKGPVFYVSKRAGAGYKIFNFYKFRTMREGAADELKNLAHLNQYGENSMDGVFFKIKNDPRISRFGQFLRSSSLDELPQLFNVVIGDMSLVGNRPLPLYEAEKLTRDQIAWRFLAPSGITGLWQITKRGKENMSPDERIALDIEYAMKNSFWLDAKIVISTFPALFQKEKV